MKPASRILIIAVVTIALTGCTIMSVPRLFSSRLWKEAASDIQSEIRCSMILDLRYRVGLVGRTPGQIIELLGKDDGHFPRSLPTSYIICPSMGDYYVLDLHWRNGRVVSTDVHDT